ncbi:hypothetical protein [Puniceicoccus vermicola]|uniref:Outer membrane protein beta-barrel domain-containing protein n=1 Tax=Puniceicoccus vermicola TaxID=388746 RepID=A0A7X1AW41_9BACT|nr:hypothetical protein [Puniceicoccus vermicola]MBC2600163.1 hypothetical protein [Puniceicoccus vermicola]
MNKSLLLLPLVSAFSLSAFGQQADNSASSTKGSFFANVSGNYIFPGEDEWDYAVGGEAHAGVYLTENLRIFGLVGYTNWELESESDSFDGASIGLSGDAGIISAGGGIDFLIPVTDSSSLTLSASIQYQFVDSSVYLSASDAEESERAKVDLDDAAAVYVGADYYFPISDSLDIFVGGGYLFNISKSDVSIFGIQDGTDTAFDGATIRAGLQF